MVTMPSGDQKLLPLTLEQNAFKFFTELFQLGEKQAIAL